ncbi:MAG TPA: ADP-forming succinate--CoA ligase subunit beta [Candidatus Mcinerneyibacteriales bacterium]|nr:ADP-forming succinate--CoA ligase subunit beta [Candidatus Mcinerneyibacteriales bacterium]HPJ70562.1 ADP-forming succinate--CoA ligase subunit beta [Candidatus Mcinerneyibacteriales bacterium]
MKLLEYQAKHLLKEYHVPIPEGFVVKGLSELNRVVQQLGGRCVVKAQILAGGRGKAGGVRLAGTLREAAAAAEDLLGKPLETYQTAGQGEMVNALLIEEQLSFLKELYFSVTYDRETQTPVMMLSAEGGVEIEEIAVKKPDSIRKVHVNPLTGIQEHHIRELYLSLGRGKEGYRAFTELVRNIYRLYMERDAAMVEINPLVLLPDETFLALDAKMIIDDNALFRHGDLVEIRKVPDDEQQEVEAREKGLSFVKLDGDVACMVNGAGLAMATMDMIKHHGMEPANFLDIGGSSNPQKVIEALDIIMKNPRVKVIFINVFGGITRCDDVANGFKKALSRRSLEIPMVMRLTGTNEKEGRRILEEIGYEAFTDLKEAVARLKEVRNGIREGD